MSQPEMPFDPQRLQQLVSEKCNDTHSPEGHEELERILASSPQARAMYWNRIAIHTALDWEFSGKEECDQELASLIIEAGGAPVPRSVIARKLTQSSRRVAMLGAAVCLLVAALVVVLGLWSRENSRLRLVGGTPESGPSIEATVGRLTALLPQSQWSLGRPDHGSPDEIAAGDTLWLDRGAAELKLANDTVVTLEAPVIMQALSVSRLRMLRGRITVDVPKGAEGFAVETASAEVIDLGTTFAVDVDGSNTDVIVFQGEVDLNVAAPFTDGESHLTAPSKRLRTGEAVRVSGDRTLSRIVNVRQTNFSLAGADSDHQRRPIICTVTDNIEREELWSFYEIVAGGMGEDARAFVDRRHEWNGADESGLPTYLVGGDYVKTFNDDKVETDLRVDVTLNRPATLYVLLDKRVTPPDWLVQEFEDTGDEIGVDEAWHDPLNYRPGFEDFAEVGPGKSIERSHSIWRRIVNERGTVTLGPNGRIPGGEKWRSTRAGTNMYGIVVVPLEDEAGGQT